MQNKLDLTDFMTYAGVKCQLEETKNGPDHLICVLQYGNYNFLN